MKLNQFHWTIANSKLLSSVLSMTPTYSMWLTFAATYLLAKNEYIKGKTWKRIKHIKQKYLYNIEYFWGWDSGHKSFIPLG